MENTLPSAAASQLCIPYKVGTRFTIKESDWSELPTMVQVTSHNSSFIAVFQ